MLFLQVGIQVVIQGRDVDQPLDFLVELADPDFEFLGFLPHDNALVEADMHGVSPYDIDSPAKQRVREMHDHTLSEVTHLAKANKCSLLVLDELCAALSLGLIDREKVLAFPHILRPGNDLTQ